MRLAHAEHGFSLLEVVIAAALLLMTVTAISGLVSNILHRHADLDQAMLADRAAGDEAERLRALPFCATGSPEPASSGGSGEEAGGTQISELFPHADPGRNRDAAYYVCTASPGDAPPGSFVTIIQRNGIALKRIARFCTGPDLLPLAGGDLEGWDADDDALPPAEALLVALEVRTGDEVRSVVAVLRALPMRIEPVDAAPEGRRWGA